MIKEILAAENSLKTIKIPLQGKERKEQNMRKLNTEDEN